MFFYRELLLLICVLLPIEALGEGISNSEFKELKAVSEEILKKFPPENYYYVGIGRSPTPILAYLNQLEVKFSIVPISSLRYEPFPFKPTSEEILKNHFKKFLPTLDNLKGKKILVMDYSDLGGTIERAHAVIQSLYSNKVEVKGLSISENLAPRLKNKNFQLLDLKNYPLINNRFDKNGFDKYAKYGSYPLLFGNPDPEKLKEALKPRVEFDELGKILKQYILSERQATFSLGCKDQFKRLSIE